MTPVFVKRVIGGREAFRVELERARRAAEIFRGEPRIGTPVVLNADPVRREIVFERIAPVKRLTARSAHELFGLAGRALGLIHGGLMLAEDMMLVRNEDRGLDGLVCVHGDYSTANLGLSRGRLVVFDWGVRPWGRGLYTVAAPAVDIASFIAPFFVPRWVDFFFPQSRISEFLRQYIEMVGRYSTITQCVGVTWAGAFDEQLEYLRGQIERRAPWKHALLESKLRFYWWRMVHGLRRRRHELGLPI